MSNADRTKPKHGVEDVRRSDQPPPKDVSQPLPPETLDETPDEAVKGRDRLRENEHRPMDPGVSDSAHS